MSSFINLVLLALMATTCGIVDSVLEHRYYPESAPWLYDDNRPGNNPSINGLITFCFALITYVASCSFAIHLTPFLTGFKILFLYLSTFLLNLCGRAKLPLYTMTWRWCIKVNRPWRVAGIYQMIWVKSSIFFRTKQEL